MTQWHSFKPSITVIVIFIVLVFILPRMVHFLPESWFPSMHHVGIVSEYIKTAIELTAIIITLFKWKDIRRWFIRKFRHKEFEGTGDEFPVSEERVHGIVIPISRFEQPAWIIHHLRPRHAALLYTNFHQSRDAAVELIRTFSGQVLFNLTEDDIKNNKDIITDAEDPIITKELTHRAIRHMLALGLNSKNIFVDTTGGRVPMSIGAFQAAEEAGVSSIYIVGRGERGLIIDPTVREQGRPIFISEKR